MILKRNLSLLSALMLLLLLAGCTSVQKSDADRLNQEISDLKSEVLLLSNSFNENESALTKIETLETQVKELKEDLSKLTEATPLNYYHEYLTDLTTYESLKFEEFRRSYDDEVLKGLPPISICKMYVFANLIDDNDTQYEFYTTNEGSVLMTKEEFLKIPDDDRMTDFVLFEDIYDLKIDVQEEDGGHAVITWMTRNGDHYGNQEASKYGFSLQKDGEVWKVSFVPMQ